MAEYIQKILEFLGVVFLEPISGLEYIHPTISIIQDNKITSWVKHIAVPISCIHGQFDIQKIWPTKILTHIQPSVMGERVKSLSMVFFLNKISLKSMVYASTHMITLIIFIRLVSIFTLCIGPHSPKIFDQTTLPCFYPVITLSSSSTLSCWCFMILISPRRGVNGTSTSLQFLVSIFSVTVLSPI